jgi:hypothetical protein
MTTLRAVVAIALAVAASTVGAAPPASVEKPKLDCARLVPAAVVARYFPGGAVKPQHSDERTALCNVSVAGNDWAAQASYLCRPTDTFAAYQAKAAEAGKKKPAIPGIGRAAFGNERRVLFYDDDTDCMVDVSDQVAEKKSVEFARDLATVLKPDLLPKVDAGTWSLPCERLLPAALIAKWAKGGVLAPRYVQADQMECKIEPAGGGMPIVVSYTCKVAFHATYWADYKEQLKKQKADGISDAGIGTGGVYASMFGMPTVTFTDEETGCLVSVMAMGMDKAKALGVATDVEKALTKESAK